MKPHYWIIPLFAITLAMIWSATEVSAATVTITDTHTNRAIGLGFTNASTVRGNDIIFVNVSDIGNATNCTLIFKSATRNDSFGIYIQNQTNQSSVTGNLTGANIQRTGANSALWMNHSATNFMPTGPGDGGGGAECTSNYCTANTTTNATFLVGNVSSALRGDATDWVVTGFCANNSVGGVDNGTEASITTTTLVFDNWVPAAATGLTAVRKEADGINLSATILNSTHNCTAWTRIGTTGAWTSRAMPVNGEITNGTVCALSTKFIASPGDGITWLVETTDNTNKTNSSTTSFTVDGGGSASSLAVARQARIIEAARQANLINQQRAAEATATQQTTKSTNTKYFLLIGGVIVVLGYTQGWFGKKKR